MVYVCYKLELGHSVCTLHTGVAPIRGKGVGIFIHPYPSHQDKNVQALVVPRDQGEVGISTP